jgi:hypothetical protein
MRRLPLVLALLALSASAQQPPADAADAGSAPPAPRSGRHFAFLWDSEVPPTGASDVQLWLTPRWGRVENYTAIDLRGGVMQGICPGFAAGFFLDATPTATGVTQAQAIDARLTVLGHVRLQLGRLAGIAAQPQVSVGPQAVALALLLAADATLGPVRVGVNADLWHDIGFKRHPEPNTRARQGVGLAYVLSNGFTAGIEASNHLTWHRGEFLGMAFLIGPAVGYRSERFWFAASLLPQVAAVKPEARRAVGDPLELTDNERMSLRLALGLLVP